jgi:hypothetical protein
VDDPEERAQITEMLSGLIPRLKVTGATTKKLGKMSLD